MRISDNNIAKILFPLLFILSNYVQAQEYKVKYGNTQIPKNQYFKITLESSSGEIENYSSFPEIEGFEKSGISSSSSISIINGSMSSTHSIIQNYKPTREGNFKLSPFKMKANDKIIEANGTMIRVVAPQQQARRRNPFDVFDDPYGNNQPQEFIDIKDNAFYRVYSDKKEVYRGEGFTLTAALYIPLDQRELFAAPQDLGLQIQNIAKEIAPNYCWEEDFIIKDIVPEVVEIKGERVVKYILSQSVFYPYKVENVKIPSSSLKMIKYKIAKQRSFFGTNAKATDKKLYSSGFTIKVKDLPEHPLKEKVSVGNFKLGENANKDQLTTDESLQYIFKIFGEGNINSINPPEIDKNNGLNVFPPNTNQSINRGNGRVTGEKMFEYSILPKEPGDYNFKDVFQWIYFNPVKEKYDTLKSSVEIKVTGESKRNIAIESNDLGDFYNKIEGADNKLKKVNRIENLKFAGNAIAALSVLLIGFVIYRHKKRLNG